VTSHVPGPARRVLALFIALPLLLAACDRSRGGARAGEWAPTTVGGITMQSPGRLVAITTEVPAAMDPAVRDAVQRIDSYGRAVGDAELRVSRVTYQPTAQLSLRGSAQGAVDAVRGNPAVSRVTHAHASVQTSGVPAIRTSMNFFVRDTRAQGEMLTVLRGQTLWQVQVLGPANPQTDSLATRVIESVQLQPEPQGG
jgi:hypothetical protein